MNELKINQKFTNGKSTREITEIDGGEIYYKTEKGLMRHCWITTFQDWVNKANKNNIERPNIYLSNDDIKNIITLFDMCFNSSETLIQEDKEKIYNSMSTTVNKIKDFKDKLIT